MSEQRSQQESLLQTERGIAIVQNSVVSTIIGRAVEVDGIVIGRGGSQTASNPLDGLLGATGSSSQTQGVSVEVGQDEVAINLTVTVEYGKSVPQLAEAVCRNVANKVESLVGLRVTEVNSPIDDVYGDPTLPVDTPGSTPDPRNALSEISVGDV